MKPTFDRLVVLVGTHLVALGIGLGIRSTAAGGEPAPAKFVPGGATPTSASGPASGPPAGALDDGDALDWSILTAYEYADGLANLPESVKALDGKPVVLRGFLTPLYEFDDIHEFILVANHMSCCFGMPAGISGQIQVKIAGERGLPNTNEPLEVRGTFRVVETKEQGYILSIFRVDDAKVRIVGYK